MTLVLQLKYMKNKLVLLVILGILLVGFYSSRTKENPPTNVPSNTFTQNPSSNESSPNETNSPEKPQVSVFVTGLEVPWAIAFLPTGDLLVTERIGRVRLVSKEGQLQKEPVATLSEVKQIGEGGLHGIALHPNFSTNNFIYLYYTYSGSGNNTLNRVVRMTYENGKLSDEKIIVDAIPGASNHDGGRIKFGPDGLLYITTGDAQEPSLAQDTNSLAGKILRVTDLGDPAPGNPFDNRVYSYGHRNPQGITWDEEGILWSTEHGPSGLETGNDEVNQIEMGANYGWPDIRGTQTKSGMKSAFIESGRGVAWAPAALTIIDDRMFFTGLRGSALYELNLTGKPNLKTHFKNEFGRLREVVKGPNGMLYVTTSNRDGRGSPKSGNDKILRVNPAKL